MRKHTLCVLSIGLLAFGSVSAGAQDAVSQASRLHPQMQRLLAERGPSVKGWVYFADKGRVQAAEIERAVQRLTPRAIERRALRRQEPGLIDLRDVDVAADYVARVEASGGSVGVRSRWLNAVSVLGTEEQFQAIAQLPFVLRIEPVRRGVLLDEMDTARNELERRPVAQAGSGPFYGASEDQLKQIGLIGVHDLGFRGSGVVIGILDTGFHRGHEAFNQPGHVVNVLAEYDFVDDDSNAGIDIGDETTQHSHGTYILGTLAAYLPGELVGAAYEASFVLAKTEDTTDEYEQEEDFFVAGLEFIEMNGADVVTSSLGYIDWYSQSDLDGLTAVTTVAVNAAIANGLHMCTAAGNSYHDSDPGTSALIAPSDAFQVITVGAVDFEGTIADFSSDGPSADGRVKPEVLAWGVGTATVCSLTDVDCLTLVNGTSLSTPVMAGLVACLTDAHPTWSVGFMRRRILATGNDVLATGSPDPLFVRGYGIPDAYLAGFRPGTPVKGPPKAGGTIERP